MTPDDILKWLSAQGIEVSIGWMASEGKRLFSSQDGRHSEANFDKLLERIKAKENELMVYLESLGDVEQKEIT